MGVCKGTAQTIHCAMLGINPARPENMQRTDVRFTCTPGSPACIDYGGGHGAKPSSHHAYQS